MPAWVAALVVAVILLAVAGLLALLGKKEAKQTMPVKPEATLHSVRSDVESLQQAAKEGRGRSRRTGAATRTAPARTSRRHELNSVPPCTPLQPKLT
ncbi:putative superfamily III holin-X [Micromonospora kangleipakensis]|uniref:Putative superfamily III holin-X n=1 Tax=Micromonospora kangleipakensis TaxID=1077942 RepID=A0A4Q8BBP8_9ACTN|nr:putative superfamily III holin-X [Micromonospora kangleipakensis]